MIADVVLRPGRRLRYAPPMPELLRLAAFTTDPSGGNPAGVWLGDAFPPDDEMQAIAAAVGYSETAFLVPDPAAGHDLMARRVRYFSQVAEVAFCGHATIAAGVALAPRTGPGRYRLTTNEGEVPLDVQRAEDGGHVATLTSVDPRVDTASPMLLSEALGALDWTERVLDPALPPEVAYAGVSHLILAVSSYAALAGMRYDFERMRAAMLAAGMTTIQIVWREARDRYRARDPFPVGGVVEDPATGAAAAALGAYLRAHDELPPDGRLTVLQGVEMGRPSRLQVEVPGPTGGIRVSGRAVVLDGVER